MKKPYEAPTFTYADQLPLITAQPLSLVDPDHGHGKGGKDS